MTREELIIELTYTEEQHKNDKVFTGGLSIPNMCQDIKRVLDRCIEIPKGATNGDIFLSMYPNCKHWAIANDTESYEVHFVQLPNSMTVNKYEGTWWNAPYKGE